MEKITPKRRKRPPYKRGKGPPPPPIHFFTGRRVFILLPVVMSGCDYKMRYIFKNYSSHNYIKMYSKTHPITISQKFSQQSISSNPLTITLNRVIYAPHDQCDHNTSGVYYNTSPLSQKFYPNFWTSIFTLDKWPFIQVPPPPPPPPITIEYVTRRAKLGKIQGGGGCRFNKGRVTKKLEFLRNKNMNILEVLR